MVDPCDGLPDDAPLRILIVGTPKCGNTWMRALLARIYDLPIVELAADWRDGDWRFDPAANAALGPRWVANQHFPPQPDLLEWARAHRVHLVTMLRHPADAFVSLYHYAADFPDLFAGADAVPVPPIVGAPPTLRQAEAHAAGYVRRRFPAEVALSLRWLRVGLAHPIRYEELWLDPVATLERLTARIAPVPWRQIERAIALCGLEQMRTLADDRAKFFRQGGIGGWRAALPAGIVAILRDEAPYPASFAALGYTLDPDDPIYSAPRRERSARNPFRVVASFDNGVPIPPILVAAFLDAPEAVSDRWHPVAGTGTGSFFAWLTAPSDGADARLCITNLAAFLYRVRADVRAVFPEAFAAHRVPFLDWFRSYPAAEYGLDDAFIAPVRAGLRAWQEASH